MITFLLRGWFYYENITSNIKHLALVMANLHESPQNKGQNDELPSSDGGGTIEEKQFICIQ